MKLKEEISGQQRDQEDNEDHNARSETSDTLKIRDNSGFLKMVIGKPFGVTKIAARIRSKITVAGHELTRNLNELSDQTYCI